MNKFLYGAAFIASAAAVSPAAATVIVFSQNFSGTLSANEQVVGNFSVNNGTVGHAGSYADDEYSYYQLALDLTGYTNAVMSFDYSFLAEQHFDRFNVLASTGAFVPPAGLLTATSGLTYTDEGDLHRVELGQVALAQNAAGNAVFDLSSFSGQLVNLRFQFGSDFSVTSGGLNIDNVLVNGDANVSAVPEPATWAMMLIGFGIVGAGLRSRRTETSVSVSYA